MEQPSYIDTVINSLHADITRKHDAALREYLRGNLAALGYSFESESAFLDFVGKRITAAAYTSRPHYWELILDRTESDSGTLVGCYSDEIKVSFPEVGATATTITATIG